MTKIRYYGLKMYKISKEFYHELSANVPASEISISILVCMFEFQLCKNTCVCFEDWR